MTLREPSKERGFGDPGHDVARDLRRRLPASIERTNRSKETTRMNLMRGRAALAMMAVSGALLSAALPAPAQEKAAAADKTVRVEEQDSVASLLKRLEGRSVKLRLAGSGDEITGKVQKVGKELVHLSEIAGRELYDAAIRIDQVSAVVVQARGR
jgi:hypothetical protein